MPCLILEWLNDLHMHKIAFLYSHPIESIPIQMDQGGVPGRPGANQPVSLKIEDLNEFRTVCAFYQQTTRRSAHC